MERSLELSHDPQAVANGYVQPIAYEGGLELPMVRAPAQIDRTPPPLQPAPAFNDDAILGELGMTQDEIIEAKIAGALA